MHRIRKTNPKTVRVADIEARLRKSDYSSKEIDEIMSGIRQLCHNCVARKTKVDKKSQEFRKKLLKAGYSDKQIDAIFDARKV